MTWLQYHVARHDRAITWLQYHTPPPLSMWLCRLRFWPLRCALARIREVGERKLQEQGGKP